jgi:hypothetical protein
MTSWNELGRHVEERAAKRCEYCRMHQALQGATFHVDHIVPRCLGGLSELSNLAWACPGCNLYKANRVDALSRDAGQPVPLFNPRTDRWTDHFRWNGYHIEGITPVGRATVNLLALNHERRVMIREAEALFDLFPPRDAQP